MVFPHEAIALFRLSRRGMPKEQAQAVRQRVLENAAHIAALGREGRSATNLPCAFLVDGKCSAYEARPAACSGLSLAQSGKNARRRSTMVATCRKVFRYSAALRYVAAALDDGMEQARAA